MEEYNLSTKTKSVGIDDLLAGDQSDGGKLDLYSSFEKTLPFVDIALNSFVNRLQNIESSGANHCFMSKEELFQAVSELAELNNGSDGLRRLITCDMFKNSENPKENLIDTQSLMLFGLLHCKSSPDEKAKLYFQMTRKQMQL